MNHLRAKFVSDVVGLLYSPDVYKVKPEEVRDALSSGQLRSKMWIAEILGRRFANFDFTHIHIVGGWIGTLANILFQRFAMDCRLEIMSSDMNPDCAAAAMRVNEDYKDQFIAITADMYQIDYAKYEDHWTINTSCEHIPDVRGWLNLLPKKTYVVLQSNNMFGVEGHINCCNDLEEFKAKAQLDTVLYAGEIITNQWVEPNHKRFMLIGTT